MLRLIVDNTKREQGADAKKREAIALLNTISSLPGGARMLRGMLSLMAPPEPQKTIALAHNLIEGIGDTGQIDTVLRVLKGFKNLPAARP
jgi:hypothetical protein